MTEWLNENARRAYPLDREWPDALAPLWTGVLLDACLGCTELPSAGRIALLQVSKTSTAVALRIGVSADSYLDIPIVPGDGARSRVYAHNQGYKVFLTISNAALKAVLANTTDGWSSAVNVPFAVRCCSYANACVTAVEAYTPDTDEQCQHPVFDARPRTPVDVLTGDVVLKASDGVDLEAVDSPDGSGTVLRVSALAGGIDEGASAKTVDLVVRGDACIAVEARPGVRMNAHGVETPDPTCGIVVIGSKCKPCCQCDDYVDAVKTLRPYDTAAAEIKRLLDEAKAAYETAAAAFDTYKAAALAAVNSYANLNASAVAVCSSAELYKSATTASGSRSRIAITLTVENMTQDTATLSELASACPGYTLDSVTWATAGSKPRSGSSVTRLSWRLKSGDTLTASWTFTKTSKTNQATKPAGMSVTARAKLDRQPSATTLSPEVK